MPLKTTSNGETVGMRLIDARLGRLGPLPKFIAARRVPGDRWRSWQKIAAEIAALTGETPTHYGVQKMARAYGIPENTKRAGTAEQKAIYLAAVRRYL